VAVNLSDDARQPEEGKSTGAARGLVSNAVAVTPASHGESQRFTVTQ
jgi:hypothetical protein